MKGAPPRGEVPALSGTDLSKPVVASVAENAVVAFGMAAALRGVADPAVELQKNFAEVIGENYPGKPIVDKWCGVDTPLASASRCSSTFQSRRRGPFEPPQSAVTMTLRVAG
jgi:hypothetical protein